MPRTVWNEKGSNAERENRGQVGRVDVNVIEGPAQLTGDHLNGCGAEEVIMLKSAEEAH